MQHKENKLQFRLQQRKLPVIVRLREQSLYSMSATKFMLKAAGNNIRTLSAWRGMQDFRDAWILKT